MSKFEEVDVSLPQGYESKDRDSNSTLAPQNECNQGCQEKFRKRMTMQCDCRLSMFSEYKLKEHLSQKLIEKTISWIEVIGYLKGHQFQTIVLSISLFYAGLFKLNPSKNQIQSLICSCIFLAGKMTSRIKYTLADILSLVNNRPTPQNILKHEEKILQIFDFNLHIQLPIIQIINRETTTQQQKQKLKFLTELLLLKDPSILYNLQLVQELQNLSCEQKLFKSKNKEKQGYKTIQKILKKLNCQHLLNKYNSKFDVGSFVQNKNDNDNVYST